MIRIVHITLVCLLLLSMQTQLPWAHRHESLAPLELAAHLQQFHAGTPATNIPHGWHVHRASAMLVDPALERTEDFAGLDAGANCGGLAAWRRQISSSADQLGRNAAQQTFCRQSTPLPLFQVYQSLLI
ncbi:hypothetical protein [Blastopirellula marina]|uniref:Uncharacterized protein n=1 Tax=Blastopirellula marina DSM 3645 TaxID=314230 RepID=A3ZLU7_9BACT|nr:hypothetical protein [Blastopirellula marina]EAQ82730.1 hypothetical protein DSM3645_10032 [Blastopirellula marina DSM 3645]